MISPVRLRAKASGLTSMSVRSMDGCLPVLVGSGGGGAALGGPRSLDEAGRARDGTLRDALRAPACAPGRGGRSPHVSLAERADLPHRIQRLAAHLAGILELAHAVGAAQEVLLHLVVAVRPRVVPR